MKHAGDGGGGRSVRASAGAALPLLAPDAAAVRDGDKEPQPQAAQPLLRLPVTGDH